jgi:hypothetical protein
MNQCFWTTSPPQTFSLELLSFEQLTVLLTALTVLLMAPTAVLLSAQS